LVGTAVGFGFGATVAVAAVVGGGVAGGPVEDVAAGPPEHAAISSAAVEMQASLGTGAPLLRDRRMLVRSHDLRCGEIAGRSS
jgi:hypothetical protein